MQSGEKETSRNWPYRESLTILQEEMILDEHIFLSLQQKIKRTKIV